MTSRRRWEDHIAKYLIARGIPGFSWDGGQKRFTGVKGFQFCRLAPRDEGGWARTPEWFKRNERHRNNGTNNPFVMFLTSKFNGPEVENSYVLMRLEAFAGLLADAVAHDPQRYLGKE